MTYITKYPSLVSTDFSTTGKVYLGDTSPVVAGTGFVNGDVWIKGWLEVGKGIISQARPWSFSLFTVPSTGLGSPSLGIGGFDLTGGTYENQFTATTQTGGWTFAAGDVGKCIVITTGTYIGAVALIEQYVSATVVTLETCDWLADLASESFMMLNIPVTFTSGRLKLNVIPANGEWETKATAHTGQYAVKLDLSAAGTGVTNERIVTDAAGYSNVDSLQIRHNVGDLAAGNLQKVVRISIDDSLCTGGPTSEIDGLKFTRVAGNSTATVHAIDVGTGFAAALNVDGSPATDPFYGYTYTAAFAVTKHSNLKTSIDAANEVRTQMLAHAASTTGAGAHPVADTVNFAAMPAACTDLATLITLVTYLLTSYAAHDLDAKQAVPTYHAAQWNDASSTLASVVAPTSLTLCMTRLLDIKAKYNVHEANTTAHTNGSLYTVVFAAFTGDASFVDPAVNTQMFAANGDGILIGSDNPFSVIQYVLQVAGSTTITPTFQYSTGDGTWATLTVSDTTTGFTASGKISFTAPVAWAKSAHLNGGGGTAITDAYYVRIARTKATAIATLPTEQYFKIFVGGSATETQIRGDGTIKPAQMADAAAASDSIYYSLTASKLCYKDSGGVVRALY